MAVGIVFTREGPRSTEMVMGIFLERVFFWKVSHEGADDPVLLLISPLLGLVVAGSRGVPPKVEVVSTEDCFLGGPHGHVQEVREGLEVRLVNGAAQGEMVEHRFHCAGVSDLRGEVAADQFHGDAASIVHRVLAHEFSPVAVVGGEI